MAFQPSIPNLAMSNGGQPVASWACVIEPFAVVCGALAPYGLVTLLVR